MVRIYTHTRSEIYNEKRADIQLNSNSESVLTNVERFHAIYRYGITGISRMFERVHRESSAKLAKE